MEDYERAELASLCFAIFFFIFLVWHHICVNAQVNLLLRGGIYTSVKDEITRMCMSAKHSIFTTKSPFVFLL